MWYSDWSRHTLIVNGSIHRAGRPERKLGEEEDLGEKKNSFFEEFTHCCSNPPRTSCQLLFPSMWTQCEGDSMYPAGDWNCWGIQLPDWACLLPVLDYASLSVNLYPVQDIFRASEMDHQVTMPVIKADVLGLISRTYIHTIVKYWYELKYSIKY